MKHRINKIILLSSLLGLTLHSATSCYDDKGNYDYHELEEVAIDSTGTGMQAEYSVMRFDSLTLSPRVFFEGKEVVNDNDAPLDYLWTIYNTMSGIGVTNKTDTIGRERVLATTINRTSGIYTVQLVVTNRNDGIKQFMRVQVSVSENLDGGWMVFYEKADMPGYSDLALIYNKWVKSNITYDRIHTNIYSNSNGHALEGHPIRCMAIAINLAGGNAVGLCTDKRIVGVSETTIEEALSFNDLFYEVPANEKPTWYGQNGNGVISGYNSEILINDNKIYTNTYSMASNRNTRFGVAKVCDNIGQLAPWNAEVPRCTTYGVVVYDQTNHAFLYAPYNSAELSTFAPQDLNVAAFDVNATGMELVMGDWGRGATQGTNLMPFDYIIMSKENERYLAVANFATTTPSDANIGMGLYDMNNCPEILDATTMSASHVGSYIYYGAGSRVYNFAYDSKQPATTAWTAPSDDEIVTCVRIQKYYHGSVYFLMLPNADQIIHIATWNEKEQTGKVYEYKINSASGIIDTNEERTYTVPGKVKDMAWKFSMQ